MNVSANKFAGACCQFAGSTAQNPQPSLSSKVQDAAGQMKALGAELYANVSDKIRPSGVGNRLNLVA